MDDRAKVRYLINGENNDKLEVVKNQVVASPALRQDFTGMFSLFSDYIKQCEGMIHHVCNIYELSAGIGRGGKGGNERGRCGRGEKGGDKGPPPTAKEIAACTHISDQYFLIIVTNI